MEYYVLKDYEEKPPKKLNVKKLLKTITILCLIIAAVILFAMYIGSIEFRRMDRQIHIWQGNDRKHRIDY